MDQPLLCRFFRKIVLRIEFRRIGETTWNFVPLPTNVEATAIFAPIRSQPIALTILVGGSIPELQGDAMAGGRVTVFEEDFAAFGIRARENQARHCTKATLHFGGAAISGVIYVVTADTGLAIFLARRIPAWVAGDPRNCDQNLNAACSRW